MTAMFSDYLTLAKPRIAAMAGVATALGYFMAGGTDARRLTETLIGTLLAAGGAGTFNNCLERVVDARMERTRARPLPAGRISPVAVTIFGCFLTLAGAAWLAWRTNSLVCLIVLMTVLLYALVYTPLKRVTSFNIIVGAAAGALPPVAGWAAAGGGLQPGAFALFLILFAWQHPHFYALAWLHREDFARGGLKTIALDDETGARTARHALSYSLLLIAASLIPVPLGLAGGVYLAGTIALGALMLAASTAFLLVRSEARARGLFRASLVYFPALLVFLVADLWR